MERFAPETEASKRLRTLLSDLRLRHIQEALGSDALLHLVGGSVRDILLGDPGCDLDFASALRPDQIIERFVNKGIHVIPTGLQHQTVTAVPVEGEPGVEVTSFRGPGMSPEGGVVLGNSIEEDLSFRDFTVNAIAWDLESPELIAVDGARSDLRARRIRAVGVAEERFCEDPLRVLRMVRFVCLPRFTLDKATKEAARNYGSHLAGVSVERIRDEFSGILVSARPVDGLFALQELGLLQRFLPELSSCDGFEQNKFHPLDVFGHTLEVVGKTRPELTLRMSALLHDIGKPPSLSVDAQGERHFYLHEQIGAKLSTAILERLRYPRHFIQDVVTLVRTHMRPIDCGPGGMRRLLRDTETLYPLWRELKEADATSVRLNQDELREQLGVFDVGIGKVLKGPDVSPLKNLAIGGEDLIGLGLEPGPRFGEILRGLHERVLDEPGLNTKERLLGIVREEHLDEENTLDC